MTTSATATQDQELQDAVEHELRWVPQIDAAKIGVGVDDGVVTLSGHVSSYSQKIAAGQAAFRTRSVKDVANDLRVLLPGEALTDEDITATVRAALNATSAVPADLIKVAVHDGQVVLTGEVKWNFQRDAAVKTVGRLEGVRGVENHIVLSKRPVADPAETEELIRRAIMRHAALDAQKIHVHAIGDSVRLTGTVSSWVEKHQAELAAWSSPHVNHVDNKIVIRL